MCGRVSRSNKLRILGHGEMVQLAKCLLCNQEKKCRGVGKPTYIWGKLWHLKIGKSLLFGKQFDLSISKLSYLEMLCRKHGASQCV